MIRRASVLLALLLVGCGPTPQDVREEPVRFTTKVPGNWIDVGECLAAAYTEDWEAAFLPIRSRRQGEVIVSMPAVLLTPKQAMLVFSLSDDGTGTAVTLTRRKLALGQEQVESQARERVEKCGRSA